MSVKRNEYLPAIAIKQNSSNQSDDKIGPNKFLQETPKDYAEVPPIPGMLGKLPRGNELASYNIKTN
jgi:hypothetical protein